MTEQNEQERVPFPMLNPRICELGKIKIGGKGKLLKSKASNPYRQPDKYDHFVITTLIRGPDDNFIHDNDLMEELLERYGDDEGLLKRVPVRVLSDEITDVMQCAWVWYGSRTCGARSDGYTVTWTHDRKTCKKLDEPLVEDWTPEHEEMTRSGVKMFKKHTVFNCIIDSKQSRWGGVYKFRTAGVITADQLYGSLLSITNLTNGILAGIPLVMVVRPMQVSPGGKATTVYVVHIEMNGSSLQQIQEDALAIAKFHTDNVKQIQENKAEYRKLLVAPGTESEKETGDIIDEFAPEAAERIPPEEPDPLLDDVVDVESTVEEPEKEPAKDIDGQGSLL